MFQSSTAAVSSVFNGMGIEHSMCCTGRGEHDSGDLAPQERRRTVRILEAKSDHERLYLQQELKIQELNAKLEAVKVINQVIILFLLLLLFHLLLLCVTARA